VYRYGGKYYPYHQFIVLHDRDEDVYYTTVLSCRYMAYIYEWDKKYLEKYFRRNFNCKLDDVEVFGKGKSAKEFIEEILHEWSKWIIPSFRDYVGEKPDFTLIIYDGLNEREHVLDCFSDLAVYREGKYTPVFMLPLEFLVNNDLIPKIEIVKYRLDPYRLQTTAIYDIDIEKFERGEVNLSRPFWIKLSDEGVYLGEEAKGEKIERLLRSFIIKYGTLLTIFVGYTSNITFVLAQTYLYINNLKTYTAFVKEVLPQIKEIIYS